MKIILSRLIKHQSNMANARVAIKEYESNVVPQIGFFIEDIAFSGGEEVKVIEVSIDYENDTCKVSLEPFEVSNEGYAIQMAVNLFEAGNWTLS